METERITPTEGMGVCAKHGRFILTEGCPQCLAENSELMQSVTKELTESTGTPTAEIIVPEAALTAVVKVAPGKDAVVQALMDEVLSAQRYALDKVVQNTEDVKSVTNDLQMIKALKNRIIEKQREYLDPIKQHVADVTSAFNLLLSPLAIADKALRDKFKEYDTKQQAIRAEQERINRLRIEAAEAEAKLHEGEITESVNLVEVQPEAPKHYRAEAGVIGRADHWKVEVLDFTLLPDEYKIADMVRLRRVVTAGSRTISGCKIWNDPDIRVTENKS